MLLIHRPVYTTTTATTTTITTTATSVLMPLSRLAEVDNFCFNLLSPLLSIIRILSSQAISFQILYALFQRFPWSTLLPFPSYFNVHNLTYRELISPGMIRLYHTVDGFELSYPWSLKYHPPYHEKYQSTPHQPVSPNKSSWS